MPEAKEKANWYQKVEVITIGPDEGPIRTILEYEAIPASLAKQNQADIAKLFIGKNQ